MPGIDEAAEVLRRVSIFIRSLTDDQIDDLLSGRARLTLTVPEAKRRAQKSHLTSEDAAKIRDHLRGLGTREAGMTYLEEQAPARESLKQVAAMLDLPILRSDSVSRLRERIIEATIGYRLRSEAIRSRDSY